MKDAWTLRRVFDAENHGEVQETFWAVRFGMLVDRFRIPWMINCGQIA
jgi:PhnB protein